jgi:hypothetical protein
MVADSSFRGGKDASKLIISCLSSPDRSALLPFQEGPDGSCENAQRARRLSQGKERMRKGKESGSGEWNGRRKMLAVSSSSVLSVSLSISSYPVRFENDGPNVA